MLGPQRYYIVVLASLFALVTCYFYLFSSKEQATFEPIVRTPYRSSKPTLRDTMTSLFDTIRHDPTSPGFIDAAGQYYKGSEEPVWTKPLGKKVLIVDIDTRIPTGENQIFNPDELNWEHLKMSDGGLVSNSIMNHYLYALIHGYDYKFYQARHIPGHYDTWILPRVLRELVPGYQFVVTMDADVIIPHLQVPFEWMFNRWGIKKHTSMALPWDTQELRSNKSISGDSKGLLVLNTGLVIAQNSKLTLDLLESWRDCTTDKKYPGCSHWKLAWSHEQRAFSEYIRYDYNKTPETIVSIPCDDAVGWPGFQQDIEPVNPGIADCNGNFIRHYTLQKNKVKGAAAGTVMQAMSQVLQKSLLKQQSTYWYKEPEHLKIDIAPPPESEELQYDEENKETVSVLEENPQETKSSDSGDHDPHDEDIDSLSSVEVEGLITDLPE